MNDYPLDRLQEAVFRKSSYSNDHQGCVEVGSAPGLVGVRDSKLGVTSPILAVGTTAWTAFTAAVRDGEFDR